MFDPALLTREIQNFKNTHSRSMALSRASQDHFLWGAPMHWMTDWPSPHLIHVQSAQGNTLVDVDGHRYIDLCLGDTGAMFGHRPPALMQAMCNSEQALTAMLPSAELPELGQALSHRFGFSHWQMALSASDANRFLIRWARAVTQKPMLLVFDGCYHGAVDDTLVQGIAAGPAQPRASLLGEVYSHVTHTRVVPFNDLPALAAALASEDVACVLAEPALTNCGMVPPDEGFWAQAQSLCQAHGSWLIMDETHTLSTGLGAYAQVHDVQADAIVMGKAVAGGWPCAVYGVKDHLAQAMRDTKASAPPGHSGIGTTLSGNALSVLALRTALQELHQDHVYAAMLDAAEQLEQGLQAAVDQHQRPWQVCRLGARLELQFMPQTPRNAQEARQAQDHDLESYLHLYMMNRGVLLTPFHNMMLCSPQTTSEQIDTVLMHFKAWLKTLA
jgi:glutamate-1-semialdehyde 2,1-aminomutase